jgi:hypothetical protein
MEEVAKVVGEIVKDVIIDQVVEQLTEQATDKIPILFHLTSETLTKLQNTVIHEKKK